MKSAENERATFLGGNLGDFVTKLKEPSKNVALSKSASETANKNNWTSREGQQVNEQNQPKIEPVKQRRFRTGRNQQLNIKATEQTVQKFYRLADDANIPLGELLERALTALEEKKQHE